MNQNAQSSLEPVLEVRNSIIFWTLLASVFILITSELFFGSWYKNGLSLRWFVSGWNLYRTTITLLSTIIIVYCTYQLFNRRVQIRLSPDGIWTKENSLIKWSDILTFRTTSKYISNGGGRMYHIYLKIGKEENLEKEVKIEYYQLDIDFHEVRNIISIYAQKYNITDLGNERLSSN